MKLWVHWAFIAVVATMGIVVSGCAPEIVSVQPTSGPIEGGTLITLRGRRFPEFSTEAVQVWVGDSPCDAVTLLDQNKMECTTSATVVPGVVDILLISSDGFRSTLTQSFEYTTGININPSSKTIGPGDSQTFEVTGGYKPYRYEITAGEGSVEEVDSEHVTYTASANTGSATVLVTDAAGETATITVTIQGAVTLALTPVSTAISTDWDGETYPFGEQIELSATGGAPPYTFSNADAVTGRITGNQTYTVIGNANDDDTITVTDSKGNTDSIDITTRATLTFTGSTTTATTASGQTITFTITDTGVEPVTIEAVNGNGTFDVTTSGGATRVWTPPATVTGAPVAETIRITDVFGYTDEINVVIHDRVAIAADNSSTTVVEGTTSGYTLSGGVDGSAYVLPDDSNDDCGADEVVACCGAADMDDGACTGGTDVISSVVRTAPNQFNFTPPQGTAGLTCVIEVTDVAETIDGDFSCNHTTSFVVSVNEPLTLRANRTAIVSGGNGPLNNIVFTAAGGIPPYTLSEAVDTASATFSSSTGVLTAGSANANGGETTIRVTDDVGNTADVKVLVLPRYEMTPASAEVVIGGSVMVGTEGGFNDLFSTVVEEVTFTSTAAIAQGNTITVTYDDCGDCGPGNEVVSVTGDDVTIDIDITGAATSSAQDIARAINLHGGASVLVAATVTGDPLDDYDSPGTIPDTFTLTGGYAHRTDIGDSNDENTFRSLFGGTQGNNIRINYDDSGVLSNGEAVVRTDGADIIVDIEDGQTTEDTVASAINTHPVASKMVSVANAGTSAAACTNGCGSGTFRALSGGTSGTAVNTFIKDSGLGSLNTTNGIYTASNSPEEAEVSGVDAFGNTTESPASTITVLKPVDVAAGGAHTCARFVHDSTGRLKCWGSNNRGQLGQGNTNDVGGTGIAEIRDLAFVDLGSGADVLEVVTGFEHTCARVRISGTTRVKCWGSNEFGQLGLGLGTGAGGEHQGDEVGEMGSSLPNVGVTGTPISISAGKYHTCVTHSNGNAECWGLGTSGQLGDGLGNTSASPVFVNNPDDSVTGTSLDFLKVAAGDFHTCGVMANGKVSCWGNNDINQVGRMAKQLVSGDDGLGNDRIEWEALQGGADAQNICYEFEDNDAIETGGPVSVTVDSTDCPLHIHIEIDQLSSTEIAIDSSQDQTPITIDTNGSHGLVTGDVVVIRNHLINSNANGRWVITFIDSDEFSLDGSTGTGAGDGAGTGTVWSGGGTADTMMSDVESAIASDPVASLFIDATVITGSTQNVIDSGGTSVPLASTEVDIAASTFATPIQIDTASNHGFSTGDLVVISNHATNTPANGKWFITVVDGDSFTLDDSVGIAAGGATGTALTRFPTYINGTVQHVNDPIVGFNSIVLNPVLVTDFTGGSLGSDGADFTSAFDIDAGGNYACVRYVDSNGDNRLACWGEGDDGQIGDGTALFADFFTVTKGFPVSLSTDAEGVFDLGSKHAAAVLAASPSGTAFRIETWGDADNGKLGRNDAATDIDDPSSAQISGITTGAVDVSAGWEHTCAVFSDGRVYCWGDNTSGQLGAGNTKDYGTGTENDDSICVSADCSMSALTSRLPTGILF